MNQPEPAQQNALFEPKKSFLQTYWLWLLVFIVLIPGLLGYLFLKSKNNVSPKNAPLATNLGNIAINNTAPTGWKNYESEEHLFSISYPQDWHTISYLTNFADGGEKNKSFNLVASDLKVNQRVTVIFYDQKTKIDDLIKIDSSSKCQNYSVNDFQGKDCIRKSDDFDAKEIGEFMHSLYLTSSISKQTVKIDLVVNSQGLATGYSIAKTFKSFISKATTGQHKTYINDKYGFSFNYPNEWFVEQATEQRAQDNVLVYFRSADTRERLAREEIYSGYAYDLEVNYTPDINNTTVMGTTGSEDPTYTKLADFMAQGSLVVKSLGKTTLGGLEAFNASDRTGASTTDTSATSFKVMCQNNGIYQLHFWLKSQDQLTDKEKMVISSFKFTK
jgi:hypothetical protein